MRVWGRRRDKQWSAIVFLMILLLTISCLYFGSGRTNNLKTYLTRVTDATSSTWRCSAELAMKLDDESQWRRTREAGSSQFSHTSRSFLALNLILSCSLWAHAQRPDSPAEVTAASVACPLVESVEETLITLPNSSSATSTSCWMTEHHANQYPRLLSWPHGTDDLSTSSICLSFFV